MSVTQRGAGFDFLGDRLTPVEILYEAERPIVFTSLARDGQLLLVYSAEVRTDGGSFVVAPTTPMTVNALQRGTTTVREALTHSWLWRVRTDPNDRVLEAIATDAAALPEDHLPKPGTPLWPEHEAVLTARACGRSIEIGRVPASVIAFITDGTRKAVKSLLDFVAEGTAEGQLTDQHRSAFDLPVQRIAYSSFAVSFGVPPLPVAAAGVLRQTAAKLEAVLAWATAGHDAAMPWTSEQERAAMLRAAEHLSPPRSVPIDGLELSGRWFRAGPVQLDHDARRKVRMERRTATTERVVTFTGRIGEVDRDKLTLILREVVPDRADVHASFAEELLDEVMQLFMDGQRVCIAGTESRTRLHVTTIAAAALD